MIDSLLQIILHLDIYLNDLTTAWGAWSYALLFLIIFLETGVVLFPFLPGDSLLFALGALSVTTTSTLNWNLLAVTLSLAAISGDSTNYMVGKFLGIPFFSRLKFFRQDYLHKTEHFYAQNGGKTIILARFIPILRTFAPFVAGVGNMEYKKFLSFSVLGTISWVVGFLSLGRLFGNLPEVKQNFHFVIMAIILISFAPVLIEYLRSKNNSASIK